MNMLLCFKKVHYSAIISELTYETMNVNSVYKC